MGYDAGFDMVPRLTKNDENTRKWEKFIRLVKLLFEDEGLLEEKGHYIEFQVGEKPQLPIDGHNFAKFSSRVGGEATGKLDVREVIRQVGLSARVFFGDSIQM